VEEGKKGEEEEEVEKGGGRKELREGGEQGW